MRLLVLVPLVVTACAAAPQGKAVDAPRATCAGRSLIVARWDPTGGGAITRVACDADGASITRSEVISLDRVRHARSPLGPTEWERVWAGIAQTGWPTASDDCRDAGLVRGMAHVSYSLTFADGRNLRTIVCHAAATPPAPFRDLVGDLDRLADRALTGAWVVAELPAPKYDSEFAIGVPECDEFITKYMRCVETKMPEQTRAVTRDSIKQTVDAWKQAASTPEGRSALANACKQMIESTKQATQALGCQW
jgi:hypothetical protein